MHGYIYYSTVYNNKDFLNQPKCPSIIDWIKKMWHIYTMGYYAARKKDEFMSFEGTMDESGNYHSQQTNTRTENQTLHVFISGS